MPDQISATLELPHSLRPGFVLTRIARLRVGPSHGHASPVRELGLTKIESIRRASYCTSWSYFRDEHLIPDGTGVDVSQPT